MDTIKKLLLASAMLLFFACGTTKSVSDGERDGSSYEKAIIVKSIPAEYQYVKKVCPGCQFQGQSLVFHKNKPYDILKYKKPNGEMVSYYFDISKFYGKGIF